jgi:hydrogenase maturation protease
MSVSSPKKLLLLAIGNNGRQDDGLGWAFAEALKEFPGQVEFRYQLQIEDAELVASADWVLFVDAWKGGTTSFFLEPCPSAVDINFSTHGLEPAVLMGWCESLFQRRPEAWLLGIKGTDWELQLGLSDEARSNLEEALKAFRKMMASGFRQLKEES